MEEGIIKEASILRGEEGIAASGSSWMIASKASKEVAADGAICSAVGYYCYLAQQGHMAGRIYVRFCISTRTNNNQSFAPIIFFFSCLPLHAFPVIVSLQV